MEKLKVLLEQEKSAAEKYEKALEVCLFDCNSFLDMESGNIPLVQGQLSPIMYESGTKLHVGSPYLSVSDEAAPGFSRATAGNKSRRSFTENRCRDESAFVNDSFSSPPTLSDRVCDLQQTILSERQADVLFELRLKSFLGPTFM